MPRPARAHQVPARNLAAGIYQRTCAQSIFCDQASAHSPGLRRLTPNLEHPPRTHWPAALLQLRTSSFERSPSRKGLKVEKVSKSNHKNPILAPPHKGAIFFCSHPLNSLEKSKIPSPGCLTPSDSLNRLQETLGRKGVCIETHSRGYNVVRTCPWCAIG